MSESTPPLPSFYLSLQQVRESELLSPARMAELEAEIEKRLTKPCNEVSGKVIESARLADLSPYGEWLYPRMDHEKDEPWRYVKNQILRAILTEDERKLLNDDAFTASCAARDRIRFGKAKHIPEGEWGDGVYHGDTYYPSIEEFKDKWVSDNSDWDDVSKTFIVSKEAEYPEYLWAARRQVVIQGLDVDGVVENCLDQGGWDDMGMGDLSGVDELQAALDVFTKANEDVVSYVEDTSIAITLEKRPLDSTSPSSL